MPVYSTFAGSVELVDISHPLREVRAVKSPWEVERIVEGAAQIDTAMERALRVISVERGYDPVDFAVVAFGGAGGLHVAGLAERLGAPKALVPPDPGLLSAFGMLASPITREMTTASPRAGSS